MTRRTKTSSTLTLLPCTIKNGVFLTNVQWKIQDFKVHDNRYVKSPQLVLHDPIKNEPIKIQLRLSRRPKSTKGRIERLKIDCWKTHTFIRYPKADGVQLYTFHLSNNVYYGTKTLETDLRQYLALIHGKTFSFGGKIRSIQKCSRETLLAFIDHEHNEDFVIVRKEKEFKIKKIILQARSPVFDAMLSSNYFKEARENRMDIKDCSITILKKMIEFLQTDFVKDTVDCEIQLYEIARKYIIQSFMDFTRLLLIQKLSMKNYRKLGEIVRKHDDKETEKLLNEWYSNNQQRHRG